MSCWPRDLLAKKAVEKGLDCQSKSEELSRAGIESSNRISRTNRTAALPERVGLQSRRLWLHDVYRKLRTTRSGDRTDRKRARRDRRVRPFRQSKLRSACTSKHQGEFPDEPAARGCFCARRDESISICRTIRSAPAKTAKTFTCATSGPSMEEINALMSAAFDPETYRRLYGNFAEQNPLWNEIPSQHRQRLPVGTGVDLHSRTSLLRRFP